MIRKSKMYGRYFEFIEINAKISSKLFSVYHERPIAMILFVKEAFKVGDLADIFRITGVKAHPVGKIRDYKFGYYWDMLDQKVHANELKIEKGSLLFVRIASCLEEGNIK
eukprot:CAMPEP_0114580800 /NCGR_PEP_ID=MMETSP0125-20121206/5002_1 /TAXON_ID=485358 ORGANISM="Aristerostoma sp., Strain ATCC 50986" /NCGR_SAMPLE_ID=MMETSP0125 /ASSEMBLY_ACC=CAM_ASM_000245 /LENGTH=109 /DNA_ID=CAMNT_0001772557 /DNA_START=116 /DNA_END=445 /DNA_ORIENTATION=-